jgi:hypothetical protein
MSFSRLQAQNVPYKIDSLKAFLYYNSNKSLAGENVKGTFSENLIDNKGMALWNTVIGEGDAKGNSNQTFVVVQIKGNPGKYTARTIRLTTYQNNKQVFQQSQTFAILDDASGYCGSFLLYNTGCNEIKLKAEIINTPVVSGKKVQRVESSMQKIIHFSCGE